MALTYGEYLRIDELLALQSPRSEGPEHDEVLFIVIHQVYELWFKQILHEIDYLRPHLERGDGAVSLATFKRILTVLKTMVGQVDILETMTPVSFLSFRSRIESASGFQSWQFREVEIALGMRGPRLAARQPEGSEGRRRLEARLAEPSVFDAFLRFLVHHGQPVPESLLHRDLAEAVEPSPELQATLVEIYHHQPPLRAICERLVDLDEGIQEWRYRHVKMVERTIGTKAGTGGSSGAEYLRKTLFRPLYPDLWAIRSHL
ncbi:MAG: tryptophan 2,3-dioxygenase family protein [Acidobacteriota bacterium]